MLISLLIIGIILAIWGGYNQRKKNTHTGYISGTLIAGCVLTSIVLVIIIVVGPIYSYGLIINEKIDLYSTENYRIESQIENVVESYKEYESGTLKEFDFVDNMEVVLAHYPELKTDNLVVEQINLYKDNNQKIKELKEEKLSYKVIGWWLFFNIGTE